MSALASRSEIIGFLGAGNMATALLRALLRARVDPQRIHVTDLDSTKTAALSAELGIVSDPDAATLLQTVDVAFLAVKPGAVVPLLRNIPKPPRDLLWISVAAGITTSAIEEQLGESARVIRTMPNTPALVGAGATALCKGRAARPEDLELAELLLGAGGLTAIVEESMMDAVTGLSGSGPAFVMLIIEALSDGGVRAGLPRAVATRLAAQTVLGGAELVLQTGKHPAELKDAVTSPGGTTIAGVEALELGGLRGTLISAVVAAYERSKALSG